MKSDPGAFYAATKELKSMHSNIKKRYENTLTKKMSLKINLLENDGDAEKEYIFLEATADVNISNYAVVDRTFNKDGKVSNVHRHFYRFPDKVVKKGEFVSLRTSKGTNTVIKPDDGRIIHRFYWGSDAPFWNDTNTEQAELLKVSTVEVKKVNVLKKLLKKS